MSHLPVDVIATSDDLGPERPDVAFFEKLAEQRVEPAASAYVGDRFESDILPAQAAGFRFRARKRGCGICRKGLAGSRQASVVKRPGLRMLSDLGVHPDVTEKWARLRRQASTNTPTPPTRRGTSVSVGAPSRLHVRRGGGGLRTPVRRYQAGPSGQKRWG